MKLKDISRTATFAWDTSPASEPGAGPYIVTGDAAGALDESFSNDSKLEIWAPKFYEREDPSGASKPQGYSLGREHSGPVGSVSVASRFNRLAWSQPGATASGRGMIAAGMDTGEVALYDPVKILAGETALTFKSDTHTGPVRGLDFNPIQKNLLLSGGIKAELFIHDLNNLGTPITPGALSTKLNEITSLQWNTTVARVFAASSSSGYTSVWDLRTSKEIVSLQYGGGAAKGDMSRGGVGLELGKRRGMSDVCWHPEQATRLITSSEDDESPIIMLWDLRNTRAPERILSGHSKGVLSVAWCKQDADLLVSCGKDNRTLLWNPQSGDIVGELPRTNDWAFQASWCPSNPNILATASFDGHIGISTLQATQPAEDESTPIAQDATDEDVFGALAGMPAGATSDEKTNVTSLTVAPKWMRRPVSATFGYGGLLTSVSNLPAANGKHQSSVVHLRTVVTEESIMERAQALNEIAGDKEKLNDFSASKSDDAAWKALQTLFTANSRDEIISLLGFSKEEVARQVQEAIKKYGGGDDKVEDKAAGDETPKTDKPVTEVKPPVIETTSVESESTSASNSLFDDRPITPAVAGGETDFFASMASGTLRNPALDSVIPHERADSSVAATIGSGASSLRSEVISKDNNFHIYPPGESDVDRLVTQALVLGDFKSAVDLCMASDRFADALLLAVRGGPELLASTQKAYFTRRTMSHPFLRVFQSIVTEDLTDIVQNADLGEWRVVFVVLCTFAKETEFANLADQLGQRLQFKWQLLAASDAPEAKEAAKTARQDATRCYLAARNLEHVVQIWISEMHEEEANADAPRYSAHALALQSFIEKVTVFRAATGYVDKELATPTAPNAEGVRTYALSGLYDRFHEYADLLATQGLVDVAAKYVQMTPRDYVGTAGALGQSRDRLFAAAGIREQPVASSSSAAFGGAATTHARGASKSARPPIPAAATSYASTGYGAPVTSPYGATSYPTTGPSYGAAATNPYAPSGAAATQAPAPSNPYAPPPTAGSSYAPQAATTSPYQPTQPSGYGQPTTQASGYGQPTNLYQPATGFSSNGYGAEPQPQGYGVATQPFQPAYGASAIPPPPRAGERAQSNEPPLVPASQRRDLPGWNDAPPLGPPKRPTSGARDSPKPTAITAPFPNSPSSETTSYQHPPPRGSISSPPPRSGPAPGVLPPPPKGGPRPPSQQQNRPPPQVQSPPAIQAPFGGQAPSNPYAAPPSQQPPSNPYGAPPPQFGQAPPQGAPSGQYAPPPGRAGPPPPRGGPRAGPPPPGIAGPPPPRAMSPLGPQGARPAQQPLGTFSPPPVAGPPPPGRMAGGPPPPGRAGPPPPGAATSARAPSHSPTPPPAETKPRHPAGDRSHIPASQRPIVDGLSAELDRIKASHPPAHLQRIVADTERRLNTLYDDLNNETIPEPTVEQLHNIVKAIQAKDANSALAMHVEMVTVATGETTHWAPGVKQLIRLGI